MRYFIIFLNILFLCGCFAVVETDGRIKSFGVSQKDVRYIIDESEKVPDGQKEIIWKEKVPVKEQPQH
ncbi:MAG: hypothetical protein PHP69_04740 [Candidatus Omnitrophica bacterium]|nr:hypothetical protein [Candidatus Omnitrophota bacterium]MDD5081578.1 hypothetical protein [Candidatus Omnitrophota bacterium]MDD5441216.1 hypothetical protein [Candidatus Omnitrophota bacterium]